MHNSVTDIGSKKGSGTVAGTARRVLRTTVPDPFLTPYAVVRIALGLLLLTAAALKGYELATEPVAGTGLLTSRWFLIGVVEFELFFGLWLLAGLYPRWTGRAALVCFIGFACTSLYKALTGEASCGCFGKLPVNPWYTLMLDATAVAALFRCRPAAARQPVVSIEALRPRLAGVVAIWLLAAIPAAVAMGGSHTGTLTEAGEIVGDGQFVILKPETWVGKRFPLSKYIDIGERLGNRKWVVLLFHHDCPNCKEVIPKYEQLARGRAAAAEKTSIALVEMPPYGISRHSHGSHCVWGQLTDAKEWFAKTPVEISVDQGIVTKVANEVPSVQ